MFEGCTARLTIFLHIPKTGGTSLRDVVAQAYRNGRYIPVYSLDPATLSEVKEQVGEADAIYGHLFYGVHKLLGVDARYVTILRDPIERVISFYRHQARDEHSEYFGAITDGMTLLDLLESDDCPQVNNHMVRIVSGYPRPEPIHDQEVLCQALANLTDFEYVGVAERMDESVVMIAQRLNWNRIPAVPWLNVSPSGEVFSLDRATREAIVNRNALDLQFYAHIASGISAQARGRNSVRRLWRSVASSA